MQTLPKNLQDMIDENPAAVRQAFTIFLTDERVTEVSFIDVKGQRMSIRRYPYQTGTIIELGAA